MIFEDELISDDSSFHGDHETKTLFEEREHDFRPGQYWINHSKQPSVLSHQATVTTRDPPTSLRRFNIYEDDKAGRQLSESVDDFLTRLPPATATVEDPGPWIYISDPRHDHTKEGTKLKCFVEAGRDCLASFLARQSEIEKGTEHSARGVQARKINQVRKELQINIFKAADECHVVSGKWMLFPQYDEVNRIWSLIAHATAAGELGFAAKVATDDSTGNAKARLICVYTKHYNDRRDVKRVLETLQRMSLTGSDRGIYYKADAYTYLDINGGNEYGLKASLYASKDVIKASWDTSSE